MVRKEEKEEEVRRADEVPIWWEPFRLPQEKYLPFWLDKREPMIRAIQVAVGEEHLCGMHPIHCWLQRAQEAEVVMEVLPVERDNQELHRAMAAEWEVEAVEAEEMEDPQGRPVISTLEVAVPGQAGSAMGQMVHLTAVELGD